MSHGLLHETSERVLTLSFDRPEKKNALTLAMYAAITAHLTDAAANPEIRAVLLRGSGGIFTAGNDLRDFMKNPPTSSDSPVGRFLDTLIGYPKPIVAAVDGVAIGVGTTLLLHCDLVYAATKTRFSMPFVPLGLCPEAASSYLLPRLAGRVRASELLLLGDSFGPEEAKFLGIVNDVFGPDDLHATARKKAVRLAEMPPAAMRVSKQLIREALDGPTEAALARESGQFFERLQSPEAAEAMAAFFAKRKPDFSRFQ